MAIETIYTAIEKITLTKVEFSQFTPELGFRKTIQWTDPDLDP